MPKHQFLIHGDDTERLVNVLKARLNPWYVVHALSHAALQSDPWEEQCAVLFVLSKQPLGSKVEQRVKRYLEQGGRVVQVVGEGPVQPVFDGEVGVGVESSRGTLVFRIDPGSTCTPLPNTGPEDIRSVQIDISTGKAVLTALSVGELGDTEETTAILRVCGINFPTPHHATSLKDAPDAPPNRPIWPSAPPELLNPTHPLPQIMLVNPDIQRDTLGWDIWAGPFPPAEDGSVVVEDENDTFRIQRTPSADETGDIMRAARAKSTSGEDEAREKVVVCPASLADAGRAKPLFDAAEYFEHLTRLGRIHGQRRPRSDAAGEGWGMGDVVIYGEAVTSTQTMLDKNPKILRALRTPFLSLATFQLTGRGRGTNQWLSPAGCLQFSLLLTLPPAFPAGKLVFVQYLAALAICDGLDADGKLGVRIKWPNDIYAFAEGVGPAGQGNGGKGKAKLGGILVNSSFVDGQWRVVVGCGINILNDLPTTSLAQLYELKTRKDALKGEPAGPRAHVPTMEEALAGILVSFEGFWNTFLHDQGFDGLLDEYLGRWLHTDQPVTLTTTTPHQALVIKTITLDYGLLRCVPDRRAAGSTYLPRSSMYDAGSEDRSYGFTEPLTRGMQSLGMGKSDAGFVDLQPDGNSFDLMSGLIKRKV